MNKRIFGVVVLLAFSASRASFGESVADLEKQLIRARDNEKAVILIKLAALHSDNEPQKTLEYSSRALSLAEKYQLTTEAVDARLNRAAALIHLGRPQDASAEFARALEAARKSGLEDKTAAALHGLGNVSFFTGSYGDARGYYRQALAIRERRNDQAGMAKTLNNLGNIAAHQSDPAGAAMYYRRALELNRGLGDKVGQGLALNNLGLVEKSFGNLDRALEYFLEAARIEDELGDLRGQAMVFVNIAILHGRLGNMAKTEEYVQRSLALYRRLGDDRGIAACLSTWGEALFKQKKFPDALIHLREALRLKEKVGDLKGLADVLGNMGNCLKAMGELDQALLHFKRCLSITEKIHQPDRVAQTLKEIGDIYLKRRDFKRGEEFLNRSLKMIGDGKGNPFLFGEIHLGLSDLFVATGDWKKAYDHHRLYSQMRERSVNEDSNRRISEMQARFESEKKEKEIVLLAKNNQLLRQDNEIQKLRLGRQRLQVYAVAAAFLSVLIIALLLFKKYLYLLAFWKKKNYIGHYRLVDQISAGGMGIVYRAAHVMDPRRPVAVKVLREEYSDDFVLRQRFKNEAVMIDQLNHPHIVKVFERGEYNQRLYIAMELLDGRSLADRIRKGQRLPMKDGVDVMDQLAQTLALVHDKGIVHRDLKPENIMLIEKDGNRNFVKLLDFDIARNQSLTRLTETGEILGTINYLPPEQIAHQQISPAGDVYSLGVVFYEMFTLEKPFWGDAPIDIVRQILEKEPIAPGTFCSAMPTELNDLILLMLSKVPGQRPTDDVLVTAIHDIRRRVNG